MFGTFYFGWPFFGQSQFIELGLTGPPSTLRLSGEYEQVITLTAVYVPAITIDGEYE